MVAIAYLGRGPRDGAVSAQRHSHWQRGVAGPFLRGSAGERWGFQVACFPSRAVEFLGLEFYGNYFRGEDCDLQPER